MADSEGWRNGDGRRRWNPAMAAAIVGGAAATTGAVWGARALARRTRRDGKDMNAVMETAITASEVAPESRGR